MTSSPESAALANHNGHMIEEIVQTLLPDMQFVGKDLDAEYHGKPLEIKSCQIECNAADRGVRPGRLWFRGDQDRVLKEEDGYYAMAAHDRGNCHFFYLAEARKLLWDFDGAKTVSWKAIARKVA